ncbi:cytochrome P450, partial [Cyathus striatus]
IAYLTCYTTLIVSILAYRLSPLHPLSKYPGPMLAKCTKFWAVYQNFTGKLHVTTLNLHRQYGSVVRTGVYSLFISKPCITNHVGPNELSITDVEALQPVLGAYGMIKGPLWEGRWSSTIIHTLIVIRDQKEHMQRRKYWSKALNVARIKEYRPALKKRVDQLVGILRTKAIERTPIDLAEWVSFFAYDFMGDMAFGEGFELMRDGDVNNLWKLMENGILQVLFYFLAFLVIVAGSDTTSTVLSSIFFNLASHADVHNKLRAEVEEYYPSSEDTLPTDDMSRLAEMPLLNAVINETLRLSPPVPTGLQRGPYEGAGKVIGSAYVPEGTAICIPPYAIHRDSRYFSPDPDRFNPDRWITDDPSFQTNHDAFIPYSIGPMNCAGKLLAQMELRAVVASLVRELDVSFQDGWDPKEWDQSLKDALLFKKGKLPVLLALNSGKV